MVTNDPYESSENPQYGDYEYWGKVMVDAFFCVLTKGIGKEPFDPQRHAMDQRRTAIKIDLIPLPECGMKFDVSRDFIAESREWAGTVLPSIKAIGSSLRDLNNKYVRVKLVKTGSTYTNKNGELKDRTTFEFVTLFPDEKTCILDYQVVKGGNNQSPQVHPDGAPVSNGEKETALKFLRVLVKKAEGDPAKLAPLMAQYPPVAKFFTADSPEVINEIAAYLAAQPF